VGFDEIQDKLSDAVKQYGDHIDKGIDKAAEFVDEKTGGKYSEHIDAGVEKAKDALDDLSESGDEAKKTTTDASSDAADQAEDTSGR
jgi:ABC-type transporter Mla subunit MlaD